MTTLFPVPGEAAELIGRGRECDVLDRLVEAARAGESRALVLRGEAGVGKTALLDYLVERAFGCSVVRISGVHSEMELAFAGLHQMLAPMRDRIDGLPQPQRDALRTAFGIAIGAVPDRFLIGLAVLTLLSDAAEEQPLICVVDDEQWLDQASSQVLAFVARRLVAESVALVFSARGTGEELAGLPELSVEGLGEDDARKLLDSALTAPLDTRIRDQIVTEARGNPLALLELPRAVRPAELAGGFALPGALPLSGRIEASFRRRLDSLPMETRRLLWLAAADPLGDPALLWRAAGAGAIATDAATPAVEAGLIEFGTWVRFRHPLVRSAAYRSASRQEMQDAHRALAQATDRQIDPDRHAWHRAQAAPGPDEDVAAELERSAGRAHRRGGLAAAAAFLERAATLTPEPARRAYRLLAAAKTKRDAGSLDGALQLLVAADAGPLDARMTAEVERLRGQIALDQRRGRDAARLLLTAARRLEPLDAELASQTHLEALVAAVWSADPAHPDELRAAGRAALLSPAASGSESAVDSVLHGLALRLTEGYASAAPMLSRALMLAATPEVGDKEVGRCIWITGGRAGATVAVEQWDFEAWQTLVARQVQSARELGALVQLQMALNLLAWSHLLTGELVTAALLIDEDRLIAEATGNPAVTYTEAMLAAWRGEERLTSELADTASDEASARGLSRLATLASYATCVLSNSLGHHDVARDAAQRIFDRDEIGLGPFVVPELAEAASRTGDVVLVQAALSWMAERTAVTPSDWALGIEARMRALISEGDAADSLYRESIACLRRTRVRAELARTHLLYGEWLRRERRRVDARDQLRTAHDMFKAMGALAFADRARRELLATGQTIGKRSAESRDDLTAQEALVARLASDGLSNPQIGMRLFISPRTVQYHLRKVFTKLDISSRNELARVLPDHASAIRPH
jgi:DNA-binding CsgD family transcriptional regulator